MAHIADSGAGINPMRYIGWSGGGNWPNVFYRGSIDELRVYNRVLSSLDIALHYHRGQGQFGLPEPSLVAGWHFDEAGAGTLDKPTSLAAAAALVEPGDLVWLTQGVYSVGAFSLVRSGTVDNPIVFRALPGARVTINGRIEIIANYNWLWGLEVTTTDEVVDATAINIGGAGVHLINNYVHDNPGHANGIGAWNHPDQIIYGNILFENGRGESHPHNIYAQNTFAKNGYKYVVDNILMDSSQVCGNCFNFHGYGECRECDPILSGYYLKGNVFKNGRFLIGGFNKPPDNNIVLENYFYQSNAQFGYRRPTQVQFIGNYLGRCRIDTGWFWGEGEVVYIQNAASFYFGNTVINPGETLVSFRTSAYLETGRSEGGPAIQAYDTFDNNTYSRPFQATFFANGTDLGPIDFSTWQSATAAAGNAFDVNSKLIPMPTEPEVFLVPNEYDPNRSHLVIYNWGRASRVSVDLAPVLAEGAPYRVQSARTLYGEPVAEGYFSGLVSIPTNNEEFLVFVVLGTAHN